MCPWWLHFIIMYMFYIFFQFVWIMTFIATILLDVDLGLLVGVVIALMTIVYRVQRSVLLYVDLGLLTGVVIAVMTTYCTGI